MVDYFINECNNIMKPLHITIQVEGKAGKVDVRPFIHIVNNMMSALRKLEQNLSKKDESQITWKIDSVQMKSPLQMTFIGENKVEEDILEVDPVTPYIKGIDEIETKGTQPQYFDTIILNLIKKMLSYREDGISSITFLAPDIKPVTPSNRALGHLYVLIAPTTKRYWVVTQVEGWLDELSAHTDNPRFVIYNPLNEAKVKCTFPKEKVKEIGHWVPDGVRVTGALNLMSTIGPLK